MFKSLRGRFILSHILPLLIVIPLMGIAITYLIESRFLVPSMLATLEGDARLISRLIKLDAQFWDDPNYAHSLLDETLEPNAGRLVLLDPHGIILATSDDDDHVQIGTNINNLDLATLKAGDVLVTQEYSPKFGDEIADAITPVIGESGELLGYIRLSYRYITFGDELYLLRYWLSGILLISLVLGAGIGTLLAVNVGAPVQRVTKAVNALANGERSEALPEEGLLETRQLAHAVNVLLKRLRSLEAARKRLLANLVHEIGRPLGAMRMGIQALRNGAENDPEFYKELLDGMELESSRLKHLLEDLSHLHEQALGVLELDYEELDLKTWLPQTVAPWKATARQKGLDFEIALDPNLLPVQADSVRLGQVIGNLLSNAIKYTPSGAIQVSAGQGAGQIWIKVSDTGMGISPELQKKLFEPFTRGGEGRRFPQGMGLGLSIAKEVIEAHGGKLEVESETGQGATFTVWLRQRSSADV